MRVDQLLVERGLASSRSQAQRLIASGVRWLDRGEWKTVAKNGDDVPLEAEIELLDASESRYVSRGGLKLEGALKAAGIDPAGWVCLDVGQSTGGFTDCLLQHGAAQVVGVDVGQAQLHDSLRNDERVVVIEKVNARELTAEQAGEDFDLIVGDLSFISMTLVLPAIVPLLKPGGHLLMLAKPQFELQPGQVGKRGIVTDTSLYAFVENRIRTCCTDLGLQVRSWFDSPIDGGDGNREFFIHAQK
ncbi:TlyA family rRNA (cytidine-2'-O)-methyltransferase [Caenimonas koreensis DSM 17982]|uniref:TlyA family rRNA (Cytidine-2'-O)-methyltransferase n=1 Tax=Caenimonas koreensis DSM 17982 TaxID=1121255 RepID=A0A844B693_9BURK|nr:TlyA family RNA methyltransferase [Caenimonas koreensis]MRD47017.1 TlyA family rRNA (cytidine-2'-O)-methyltransferase [Caenimonas koreensis DSM 17982]